MKIIFKQFVSPLALTISLGTILSGEVKADQTRLMLSPPPIVLEKCNPSTPVDEGLAQLPFASLSDNEKFELAKIYYKGSPNVSKDFEKAANIIDALLKTSKDQALRARLAEQKAIMLSNGLGYREDFKEALRLLKADENQGGDVQVRERRIAKIYYDQGLYDRAIPYFEKALVGNNAEAAIALATIYQMEGGEENIERAERYYVLAQNMLLETIAAGSCNVYRKIGQIYERADYLPGAAKYASDWYFEGSKTDDVSAKLYTVKFMDRGFLEDKKPLREQILKEAIILGSNKARYELGKTYLLGADAQKKEEALELLAAAAKSGDFDAYKLLIKAYGGDFGVPRNAERQLFWMEKVSHRPDVTGELLYDYARLSETHNKAMNGASLFELYERAAAAGDVNALSRIGLAYKYGRGVKRNPVKALRYFRSASLKGGKSGFDEMEAVYRCGIGKDANSEKALDWRQRGKFIGSKAFYEDMAEEYLSDDLDTEAFFDNYISELKWIVRTKGGAKALVYLSALYNKKGDAKNSKYWKGRAFELDALRDSDFDAHYNYALLLESGVFIERDDKTAIDFLEKAAKHGHKSANRKLGDYYAKAGQREKAVSYYKKAIERLDEKAMISYAELLLEQNSKDIVAINILEGLADNGDISAMMSLAELENTQSAKWFKETLKSYPCDVKEMSFIAQSYNDGINGAPLDKVKAAKWFEFALTNMADDEKQDHYKLAKLYLDVGQTPGMEEYADKAVSLILKAKQNGDEKAKLKYADMLLTGVYVKRNVSEAIEMYLEMAKQGNAEAMYILGKLYLSGYGVEPSLKDAKSWLTKASEQGVIDAKRVLDTLK